MPPLFLSARTLRRTAAVVGDRSNIVDRCDLQTGNLQASDGSFSSRTGTLDVNFNGSHAVVDSGLGSCFGSLLSGKRSGLTGALVA